jgi:hypothetical protein
MLSIQQNESSYYSYKGYQAQGGRYCQEISIFEAYDSQTRGGESLQSLATNYVIIKRTASNWLKQRQTQGSPAYRRSRKLLKRLGRQPKLTDKQLQRLLSPSNPV